MPQSFHPYIGELLPRRLRDKSNPCAVSGGFHVDDRIRVFDEKQTTIDRTAEALQGLPERVEGGAFDTREDALALKLRGTRGRWGFSPWPTRRSWYSTRLRSRSSLRTSQEVRATELCCHQLPVLYRRRSLFVLRALWRGQSWW